MKRWIYRARLLLFPLLLAAGACDEPSTMRLDLGRFTFDPHGTEGLHIVYEDGETERSFEDSDFRVTEQNRTPHTDRFEVADAGRASVRFTYLVEGRVASSGEFNFRLASSTDWVAVIARGGAEDPVGCFGCLEVRKFPVAAWASVRPSDQIWVLLSASGGETF